MDTQYPGISQIKILDRARTQLNTDFTTLVVKTFNSLYRVVVLDPPRPRILIQGGAFFPQPTEASLAGASFGGSMLKLAWLGCGLRMEVCSDGQRIVTSPVKSIEVERDADLPGPF